MLTIPLLTAAASAGLLGGVHCAAMCGSLTGLLMKQDHRLRKVIPIANAQPGSSGWPRFWLHAGRISAYIVAGAVLGFAGQKSLLFPGGQVHMLVMIAGYIALALLGFRLTGLSLPGLRMPAVISDIQDRSLTSAQIVVRKQPFIAGLAWGMLPCGLLYSVVPLAIFSGNALSGGLLMAVFGLGALPHLLLSQKLLSGIGVTAQRKWLSVVAGLLLIGLAIAGMAGVQSGNIPDWLCVVPPK